MNIDHFTAASWHWQNAQRGKNRDPRVPIVSTHSYGRSDLWRAFAWFTAAFVLAAIPVVIFWRVTT
jgi:hypothetical protein